MGDSRRRSYVVGGSSWSSAARVMIGGLLMVLVLTGRVSTAAASVNETSPSGFLIYQCGSGFANLCRVKPDGTGKQQLTSDGTAGSSYSSPSLSRAGTRLAFIKGGAVFSAAANTQSRHLLASGSGVEAHIAPGGARVMAVLESGFGSNLQIESWPFAGSTTPSYDYYPTLTGGWGPD